MDIRTRQELALKAMEAVYGPFVDLTEDQAAKWSPPSEPGAGGHRGRYLWTDAFGVVNFITIAKETWSSKYMTLAKRLVQTVHDVLGRTRDGTARLDGSTDKEPLKGGLRIGKLSDTGNDQDGQYHHYLTMWMFALNRLSVASGSAGYNDLAIQLAKSIHPHFFVHKLMGSMKMVWQVSVDLKHVLVSSQGHLDPITGFVIYRLVQDTAISQGQPHNCLQQEISDYLQVMGDRGTLHPSDDLLDLGMGLWIAHIYPEDQWAVALKQEAMSKARDLLDPTNPRLSSAPAQRLAFREFGACLGIQCFDDHSASIELRMKVWLEFWRHQVQSNVTEPLPPISQVMFSTALVPGGETKPECQTQHCL